jgi:hypothetical protein
VSTSPVILAAGDGMFGTEMAIGSNNTLYTERYVNGSRLVDARKLDGEKLWTANVGCSSDRCPISVDGSSNALIGTGNFWTLLNTTDGARRSTNVSGRALAVSGNARFYTFEKEMSPSLGKVFAFDTTGDPIWQTFLPGVISDRVLLDSARDNVYVISRGGSTTLSAATGVIKWIANPECYDASQGAISADGTLYVTCDTGGSTTLYAYAPGGTKKWSALLSSSPVAQSPLIDANGNIFVADEATVTSLSPSGALRWRLGGFRENRSSPVIDVAGNVYVLASRDVPGETHLFVVRDGAIVDDKGLFRTALPGGFALTSTGAVYYSGALLLYFQSAGFDPAAQWPQLGRDAQRSFSH